ncbi:hypothetical protein FRC06_007081 [Ceratobasidium sp. 370]|nr:hypothetical protein FRC06_007081 [Ceratobasidium sp. 370]
MSNDESSQKRPQRRAAQVFVSKLSQLTGSARSLASQARGVASNHPAFNTPQPTQDTNSQPHQTKKRKADWGPHSCIVQPEPTSKRQKTSLESVERIMSRPYDQLMNDPNCCTWLRAALTSRGETDFDDETSVDVLKDMYDEIEVDPDAGAADTTRANASVYTGLTTPMKRSCKLGGTDHTTIGFTPTLAKLPHDSPGKPDLPANGTGANLQPGRPSASQQPNASTTSPPRRMKITPAQFHELRREALLQAQRVTNLPDTPGAAAQPHISSSPNTHWLEAKAR